jgi:uncharacterized membrane protein
VNNKIQCEICKKKYTHLELYPLELVNEGLLQKILSDVKSADAKGYICLPDFERYQLARSRELLQQEVGELNDSEKEVLSSLGAKKLLAASTNLQYDRTLTLSQKVADHISDFGGSWKFIGIFGLLLMIWIGINSWILIEGTFDPYPYIFLNLVLAVITALQAPIIMMSQNRQEQKDRITAENDYKVNLKSELLILQLTAKIDHLMKKQWMRMLEHQQMQIEAAQAVLNIQLKLERMEKNSKPKESTKKKAAKEADTA